MERDLEYWKKRCELAEKCMEESPCDPDITTGQIEAHAEWDDFRKGTNREENGKRSRELKKAYENETTQRSSEKPVWGFQGEGYK